MPKKTKILIVEDEIIIADYIFNILSKEGYANIRLAHKTHTALEAIKTFEPEIILMDINLSGVNDGIELAKSVVGIAKIIFITGQYDEKLMTAALATSPESYLTKPIKKEQLIAAVKLVDIKNNANKVMIKEGYDTIVIKHEEILYLKSDNNYIDVYTTTKKYSLRTSLDKFTESFLNHHFVRIHRSYVVNKTKVDKKTVKSIFIGEIEIPYTKKYLMDL